MSNVPADVIQQIEQLNCNYICALDALDMSAWLACFNKQGQYTFIAEENYRRNLPIAFMLDDCYERLQDRVTQVVDIQSDSTEHYQTRHFTQLISVTACDDGRYQAEFNYSVYYTRSDTNQTQLMCVGRYIDLIDLSNACASYIDKKAVTDTNVLPRYVAYPI
jgi:3-phenylpropionate/cinnamic acid dioxygenase small subunit